jgi:hypothetical protein
VPRYPHQSRKFLPSPPLSRDISRGNFNVRVRLVPPEISHPLVSLVEDSYLRMVYYFTSSVVDPPGFIYVGKDKFESMPPPHL